MEEMLEMITWAQLGIHKKPVNFIHAHFVENSWYLEMHFVIVMLSGVSGGPSEC